MASLLSRGILIAVEGIDGAGKTTQVRRLAEVLERAGFDVVTTKEPTDRSEWGRLIRASAVTGRLDLTRELHAFLEDRREHVESLIGPALQAGKIVLVDRYYFSSVAYQGARGGDAAKILRLNEAFAPVPDLLVHLEVEPAVGIARIRSRGDQENTFEQEADLRRAGEIFGTIDRPFLLRLDGRLSIEEITHLILARLHEGVLRDRLCGVPPCDDPVWCVCREVGSCRWWPLKRDLGLLDPSLAAAVAAIAKDVSLTPAETAARLQDLARSYEAAGGGQ